MDTWVDLRRDESYWDRKKVAEDALPHMLKHEQGHFYLARIIANDIKKALSKRTYSENYEEEVREQFHIELRKGGVMNAEYETETVHGRHIGNQRK